MNLNKKLVEDMIASIDDKEKDRGDSDKIINELKKILIDEKIKNKRLEEDNQYLKEAINILKKDNEDIPKKLENEINKLNETITKLKNEIMLKDKEIENYKKQNNSINKKQSLFTLLNVEDKIFSVIFKTEGKEEDLHYKMSYRNSDLFVRLEEKLYNAYPKYKNYEAFFLVNNRKILRFKTMEENNIKDNDIIFIIC